jgi:hypothetical protein
MREVSCSLIRKRRHLSRLSTLAQCALAFGLLHAQTTSSELRGTIQDPFRAVIPKVKVAVKNIATGALRSTMSNGAGIYSVPDLQPSRYEMTVSVVGFASQRRTNIGLTIGSEEVLNITLSPSSVNFSIDVNVDAPGIEQESAALNGVEDARTMRELSLNGRDWR